MLSALEAGAAGFQPATTTSARLLTLVKAAAAGGSVLSVEAIACLVEQQHARLPRNEVHGIVRVCYGVAGQSARRLARERGGTVINFVRVDAGSNLEATLTGGSVQCAIRGSNSLLIN